MTFRRWNIAPIPPQLDDAARERAGALGLSLSRYVRRLVEQDTGMVDTTREGPGRPRKEETMRYIISVLDLGGETEEECRELADAYEAALDARFEREGVSVEIEQAHGTSGGKSGARSYDGDYDAEERVNEIARDVWERLVVV